MAGGVDNDIRSPWPKGGDSVHVLTFIGGSILASKASDFIVDTMTAPFSFKAIRAEVSFQALVETNAITLNLQDDTAVTPKELITDAAITDIADGAGGVQELAVDKTKVIYAGALLYFSYKSGVSDTAENVILRVWVQPVY